MTGISDYIASSGGSSLTAAIAIKKMYDMRQLTIESVEFREFDNGTKPVARFEEVEETLVLNKTNARALAAAFGDDETKWKGRRAMLLVVDTRYNGEPVKGISLKPIAEDKR